MIFINHACDWVLLLICIAMNYWGKVILSIKLTEKQPAKIEITPSDTQLQHCMNVT